MKTIKKQDPNHKTDPVKITCGNETEIWESREEAIELFFEAMIATEGSEQSRYVNIYTGLLDGLSEVTDEE